MSWNKRACWAVAVLAVGCSSRLSVDTIPPGSGGTGGIGGSDAIVGGGAGGSEVLVSGGTGGTHAGTGGMGGVTNPPAPGTLGQSCIPSTTTTDAMGTFAQADIGQPASCNSGLTCGSDGVCAAIPDCPQAAGVCFVRRADPGVNSGGGAGGSGGSASIAGTGGGQGIPARPEPTVVALAADDAHLYWLEYGSRDSLGNYQGDGALMSFAFDGGATKKLASALPGPVGLGVTSIHAYVYVDGAPLIGKAIRSQLLRVPLAGGQPELVQDGTAPGFFLAAGDQAFWTTTTGIESVASSSGALPSEVYQGYAWGLRADATDLYFADNDAIQSAPLAGGPPQSLGLTPLAFAPKDDFLYGIEEINNGTGLILNRATKRAGTWQRIRALGAGGGANFQVAGDRYFWSSEPPQIGPYLQADRTRLDIQTALFNSADPPVRLIERPVQFYYDPFLWLGTATTLFWTDGSAIYSQAL